MRLTGQKIWAVLTTLVTGRAAGVPTAHWSANYTPHTVPPCRAFYDRLVRTMCLCPVALSCSHCDVVNPTLQIRRIGLRSAVPLSSPMCQITADVPCLMFDIISLTLVWTHAILHICRARFLYLNWLADWLWGCALCTCLWARIYTVSGKKGATLFFAITLPNRNRSFKILLRSHSAVNLQWRNH